MRNDDIDRDNLTRDIPHNAVSLYGQNEGMDDFPVLKAFQQYIDAEQEKARKRILGLSIFFGVFLLVVVAVFMVLLHSFNARNQALSDRLVEYAMNEAKRPQSAAQPAVVQPSAQNEAALKSMTAALTALQQQIQAKNETKSETPATSKSDEVDENVRKQKALLEVEKQRLAVEKERLHQIEVDQQRRKLYPELYRSTEDGARAEKSATRVRTRTLTDEDIREILREAYPDRNDETVETLPAKKTSQKDEVSEDNAIEYFKDDEYTIPVDVKGSSNKVRFTVPVE